MSHETSIFVLLAPNGTSLISLDPLNGPSIMVSCINCFGTSWILCVPCLPMNPTTTSRSIRFPSFRMLRTEVSPLQYSGSLSTSETISQTLSVDASNSRSSAIVTISFSALLGIFYETVRNRVNNRKHAVCLIDYHLLTIPPYVARTLASPRLEFQDRESNQVPIPHLVMLKRIINIGSTYDKIVLVTLLAH